MFKLLDRYILKKYLATYVFVVLIFCSIIMIIDYTEKNDDFSYNNLSLAEVMGGYYLNVFPYLANFLSPILIFISTLYVNAQMASHTEVIAILSSGVTYLRFIWSYMIGAIIVGVFTFFIIGWVLPKANLNRISFEKKYFNSEFYYGQKNTHIKLSKNADAFLRVYDNHKNVGYNFAIHESRNGRLVYELKSNRLEWDSIKSMWHLDEYTVRTFENEEEKIYQHHKLDTTLAFAPSDFKDTYKLQETMTNTELQAYINVQKKKGYTNYSAFLIELYERYTYPFAIIILTFIGVVVSSRKSREGIGAQIVLGVVLAFSYILLLLAGRSFTQDDTFHPLFSAWLPNLVFIVIGAILYRTVPK